MGLVTKRNEQLEKLFDQLATDPKRPVKKPATKDETADAPQQDEKK